MTKKAHAASLTVLLSAIYLTSIASAQTSWWRTYGGSNSDEGGSVAQTLDGGYVVAGYTYSFGAGNGDVYLVKTDASGDTLWTRTYGGPDLDGGSCVRQTADGGYVIVGTSSSFTAMYYDLYLVKTDATGDTLWTRTYGGPYQDRGHSVQQTSDGGYVVVGTVEPQFGERRVWLLRLDASGDTLWTRTFRGVDQAYGCAVQQTTDGGYIIGGYTNPTWAINGTYVYLVKTDSSGDTLWTRTYGSGGPYVQCYSVQQTEDGGYIAAGATAELGAGTPDRLNLLLIRTDASGDTLWVRAFGGLDNENYSNAVQTADGGFVVAGYTASYGAGESDFYVVKTDASGDTLWTRTYGDAEEQYAGEILQANDGGYVVVGSGHRLNRLEDVYLIKTDSLGNVGIEESLTRHLANLTRFLVEPNPFTSFARVQGHEADFFVLSDVTGRQVAVCKGDRIGAGLRPGVYFLSPVGRKTDKAVTVIRTGS